MWGADVGARRDWGGRFILADGGEDRSQASVFSTYPDARVCLHADGRFDGQDAIHSACAMVIAAPGVARAVRIDGAAGCRGDDADGGQRCAGPPRSMTGDASLSGHGAVFRHRTFLRPAPMGCVHDGGLISMQSRWAGPRLIQVCGSTPNESSQGLFAIKVNMLVGGMA